MPRTDYDCRESIKGFVAVGAAKLFTAIGVKAILLLCQEIIGCKSVAKKHA